MPLDAAMLRCVCRELDHELTGACVERILQPTKDEIVLVLHHNRENIRLLLNAGANYPRICRTNTTKENPIVAPMFCMLLRKHLSGAKLLSVAQIGFERAVRLQFKAYDEMGFVCTKSLILEAMGRYSNLIFCDQNDKIYSALKLIDFSTSQKRQVLGGMKYENPPEQGKQNPLCESQSAFAQRLAQSGLSVQDFITQTYYGIAKYTAFQIAKSGQMNPETAFVAAMQSVVDGSARPYLVTDEYGIPQEFTFLPPILQQGQSVTLLPSFSELLCQFYDTLAAKEYQKRRTADLAHQIATCTARLQKKIQLQRKELAQSEKGEEYKNYADLITSQMYLVKAGMEQVDLCSYDTDPPTIVTVPLQKNLSPAQNAQLYYKRYRKGKKAAQILTDQILQAQAELDYLATVSDSLERAEGESDFTQIRIELQAMGASFAQQQEKAKVKMPSTKPMRFETDGKFTVLCGKNNTQNDQITTKMGEKQDIWFHVKNAPGSHVLLRSEGRSVPDLDLQQAAIIAATYSSLRAAGKITVDYTPLRYVKKPNGAKPGFVIYHQNQSANVDADLALCQRLRKE